MSITHIEALYMTKVMGLYRQTPQVVINAYRECFSCKFEDRTVDASLIKECATLDANDGFDDAACFQNLWEEAKATLKMEGEVTARKDYKPCLSLVKRSVNGDIGVIATFNNDVAKLPEKEFMATVRALAGFFPDARLVAPIMMSGD